MIYTITLNPSLDYVVRVNDFQVGGMNRCSEEQIYVGGKGINVSLILHQLGIENEALGFVAGFTGGEIIRLLDKAQVKHNFITLKEGMSRINMKLKSGEETEINLDTFVSGFYSISLNEQLADLEINGEEFDFNSLFGLGNKSDEE